MKLLPAFFCSCFLAAVVVAPVAHAQGTIAGKARVIDGNTIEIARQEIRLYGIDAPETEQNCIADRQRWTCGQHSSFALGQLISRNWVYCHEKDRDAAGRIVAVCNLAGGAGPEVNASMVMHGYAMADRQVTQTYVPLEDQARRLRRGLWAGDFVPPSDWRLGQRLAPEQGRPDRCLIKGGIRPSGLRIYHVPGGRYYDLERVDEARGERWFCSEADALAAGWRKSLR
jgi:endonuclease YncB( thermonuclease family)